jgi:hypothetical protein
MEQCTCAGPLLLQYAENCIDRLRYREERRKTRVIYEREVCSLLSSVESKIERKNEEAQYIHATSIVEIVMLEKLNYCSI